MNKSRVWVMLLCYAIHTSKLTVITCIGNFKQQLHERFSARAVDAIFSNFVASPERDENSQV